MRELQDLLDLFPYCLLVVLPVFILLSPVNPCEAAHEFPVHRLAQYELSGISFGSKASALSLEARAKGSSNLLRKAVVAKLKEVSAAALNDFSTAGVGGLLLLVPSANESLSTAELESVSSLEEHLLTGELQFPVYFADESAELLELLNTLKSAGEANDQKSSGARALLDGIVSNGYQLVVNTGTPKALADQTVVTLEGTLRGLGDSGVGEEDPLPTVVVAAHYDAGGAAPGLAFGADSNGSGVSLLMELARMWGHLYSSSKSKPAFNLVFLLTGGGKINYLGTRRWLDDRRDADDFPASSNIKMSICLDSVGLSDSIHMHVSKPPKEGTPANSFFANLKSLAKKLHPETEVSMVHKKINLASEFLSWEHERFSIAKLSAFTLSRHPTATAAETASILDRRVDEKVLLRNVRLLAEALACTLYQMEGEQCRGQIFGERSQIQPSIDSIRLWTEELSRHPRGTGFFVSDNNNNGAHSTLSMLTDSLGTFVRGDLNRHVAKREKREPEFTFYDDTGSNMTAYRVKPAVFDLVLTLVIAAYLGVVYAAISRSTLIFKLLAASSASSGGASKPETNGKVKAH